MCDCVCVRMCITYYYVSCASKGNTGSETINISYFYHFQFSFFLLKIWLKTWSVDIPFATWKEHCLHASMRHSLPLSMAAFIFHGSKIKKSVYHALEHQTRSFLCLQFCASSSHDLQTYLSFSHVSIVAYRFCWKCSCSSNCTVALIKTFLFSHFRMCSLTSPNVFAGQIEMLQFHYHQHRCNTNGFVWTEWNVVTHFVVRFNFSNDCVPHNGWQATHVSQIIVIHSKVYAWSLLDHLGSPLCVTFISAPMKMIITQQYN